MNAPSGTRAYPTSTRVRAVVCDWAGVLTNPVAEILARYCRASGISATRIGSALTRVQAVFGEDPFTELECGRLTESTFLERVRSALAADGSLGPSDVSDFRATWFAGVRPNVVFQSYLHDLRRRGLAVALLTNNVREWSGLWRTTVRDLSFDTVVCSADEGVRKPDPEIYDRTVRRLAVSVSACLLVDDSPENCSAAEALGMQVVCFATNSQAIRSIEARLSRA